MLGCWGGWTKDITGLKMQVIKPGGESLLLKDTHTYAQTHPLLCSRLLICSLLNQLALDGCVDLGGRDIKCEQKQQQEEAEERCAYDQLVSIEGKVACPCAAPLGCCKRCIMVNSNLAAVVSPAPRCFQAAAACSGANTTAHRQDSSGTDSCCLFSCSTQCVLHCLRLLNCQPSLSAVSQHATHLPTISARAAVCCCCRAYSILASCSCTACSRSCAFWAREMGAAEAAPMGAPRTRLAATPAASTADAACGL